MAQLDILPPARLTRGCETIPVFARWFGSWQVTIQRQALDAGELRRRYDQAAPRWQDKLDRLGVPDAYDGVLHRALATRGSPLHPQSRVLDCGVGSGGLSAALARATGGPFILHGVDMSPAMLLQAEEILRETGVEAHLRSADAHALPYPDDHFDLVMSAHMLEHCPHPQLVLAEMARVLRPGGLLVLCITRASLLGMLIHLSWRTHTVTPSRAEGWLTQSGFDGVRRLAYGSGDLCSRMSLAFAAVKAKNPPSTNESTKNLENDAIAYKQHKGSTHDYESDHHG